MIVGGWAMLAPAETIINAYVDPRFLLVTNFAGWGTSLCWWANVTGGYANRDTYASSPSANSS